MASEPAPVSSRLHLIWIPLVLLVLLIAVYWYFAFSARVGTTLSPAAQQAFNRGIGSMEQFDYPKAAAAFGEVVTLHPDWLPGRINQGIALLNTATPDDLAQARALFADVLRRDPMNPAAHYCLGIIAEHEGKAEEAAGHFEAVTRIDPGDANAWYHLGSTQPAGSPEATRCFEKARALDPHLSGAIYGLAMNLRQDDPARSKALLEEHRALREAGWDNPSAIKYGEMGRHAEVLGLPPASPAGPRTGPLPLFQPDDQPAAPLPEGSRWAKAADLGQGPTGDLRRVLRARFGGVTLVLDADGDGQLDLLLLSAAVRAGQVEDVLLHNEAGKLQDATPASGLPAGQGSLGGAAGDFDNDGDADLFLSGVGAQRLLRNTGAGKFEDVTAQAGLDTLGGVCLGAAWIDLDQDGDLDLVVARYAASAEDALHNLQADPAQVRPGSLVVLLNVGEAPPAQAGAAPLPLTPRFRPLDPADALKPFTSQAVVNVAVSDLDLDRDLDLLVLADHPGALRPTPEIVRNERLLRFRTEPLTVEGLDPGPGRWNGALVLDVNHDGRFDLFLTGPGERPVLLLNRAEGAAAPWSVGATQGPSLRQAQALDIDLDGWTDVLGLSREGRPVLLHNQGGPLVHAREALGRDADWPADLVAALGADFNGDGFADLLVWSEATGPRLLRSLGNGHHALKLTLTGHRRIDERGNKVRCNTDAIGARVFVHAQELWTDLENATLAAGLGQSRQPLTLGLGRHPQADVVRVRWPDNTWQAEFDVAAGKVVRIEETNRKTTSCPVLFAWDGRRFGFVTDFLGAGALGELQPDGSCRPPRPEESVKIEPNQLVPRDGRYILRVAEPMDEVIYLDGLQLVVLDHPADVQVYPDERFTATGPPPTQQLLAFREAIHPVAARDHRGRDVTATLRAWDRDTVRDFARRSWLGYAEEHAVELDFGDRLSRFGPSDPLVLCLAGWTDYPYPEAIWAAEQAGVPLQPPVLERLGPDGRWHTLLADPGFPAGLPRRMTVDVTGRLTGPRCVLRLRTSMEVYWDQILVAPLLERSPAVLRETPLEVASATLAAPGCAQEFSPDGRQPTLYDRDRLEPVPRARFVGRLTRLGDVTELVRQRDDRHAIFGPGEEVTAAFDARTLPDLPPGWSRSYVLRSWGYSKDCAPFTATGEHVEPLPFRGMSRYPYGADERYPHPEDVHRLHTRQAPAPPGRAAP